MTFSELRRKDIICITDGRLIGRACDLSFDVHSGQLRAIIVSGGGFCGVMHSEKNQTIIGFQQIVCIGDDVILVNGASCGG